MCVFSVRKRLLRTFVYCYAQCIQFWVGCTAFASVCVRLLRSKRLLRTYTVFDSFNVFVMQSRGFVDSFDVPMIRSLGSLIRLTFVRPLVMIGSRRMRKELVGWMKVNMVMLFLTTEVYIHCFATYLQLHFYAAVILSCCNQILLQIFSVTYWFRSATKIKPDDILQLVVDEKWKLWISS